MPRFLVNDLHHFWEGISWVLLDMDGTLLDKHFDDYFWEFLVPQEYAKRHDLSLHEAQKQLFDRYRMEEGNLNWTDLDFWSEELELDIPALKGQIQHLIETHPYVKDFLRFLKQRQKMVVLVTNAHYKTLDIKMKQTNLGIFFDWVITSFDMGLPKEMQEFWERLKNHLAFDPQRALLIDDNEEVLRTAKAWGIRHTIYKARPSSKVEAELSQEFPSIIYFKEIM